MQYQLHPKAKSNKDLSKQYLLHPNSRKTAQIAKKNVKANAREKTKLLHQVKVNLLGEKILWFKEHLLPDIDKYTGQQTIDLIELYLKRFDEELEQIALKHSIGQRKGRQHASREDIIRLTLTQEREEFHTCGIECPDVMNTAQLTMLRKWGGELRYLQKFKLKRFSKKVLQQPPKPPKSKPSTSESTETIADIEEKESDSTAHNIEMDTM
ncbi:hypothetical protein B566_EDAN012796 [Ephemera danica]|nr:hypothetical protein B566_EDAN012796 [Ephemera danica]